MEWADEPLPPILLYWEVGFGWVEYKMQGGNNRSGWVGKRKERGEGMICELYW